MAALLGALALVASCAGTHKELPRPPAGYAQPPRATGAFSALEASVRERGGPGRLRLHAAGPERRGPALAPGADRPRPAHPGPAVLPLVRRRGRGADDAAGDAGGRPGRAGAAHRGRPAHLRPRRATRPSWTTTRTSRSGCSTPGTTARWSAGRSRWRRRWSASTTACTTSSSSPTTRWPILGGRNIGDEYFGLNAAFNFHDLDVLGVGPVARQACDGLRPLLEQRLGAPHAAVACGAPSIHDARRRMIEPGGAPAAVPPASQLVCAERRAAGPANSTALRGKLAPGRSRVLHRPAGPRDARRATTCRRRFRDADVDRRSREVLIVNAYIIPGREAFDRRPARAGRRAGCGCAS
ncbi:MAG: hypothetical protein MZU95_10970 [Desulfomicrobium escambiense]|nr:hypothetical protein [Desulfomicrobium escambiense]